MKILFLVHMEEMFREMMDLAHAHVLLNAHKYDRIIHMSSYIGDDGLPHIKELDLVVDEVIEFAWGYEKDYGNYDECDENCEDMYSCECGSRWVIESSGHDYTWCPPEIRENVAYYKEHDIFVGGGYEYECLADFESVLDHLDIDYELVDDMVY